MQPSPLYYFVDMPQILLYIFYLLLKSSFGCNKKVERACSLSHSGMQVTPPFSVNSVALFFEPFFSEHPKKAIQIGMSSISPLEREREKKNLNLRPSRENPIGHDLKSDFSPLDLWLDVNAK